MKTILTTVSLLSVLMASAANATPHPEKEKAPIQTSPTQVQNIHLKTEVDNHNLNVNVNKVDSRSNSTSHSDANSTSTSTSTSNATGGSATLVGGSVSIDNRQQSISWINNAGVSRTTLGVGATLVNGEIVPQAVINIPFGNRADRLSRMAQTTALIKECPEINKLEVKGTVNPEVQRLLDFCKGIKSTAPSAPVVVNPESPALIPVPSTPIPVNPPAPPVPPAAPIGEGVPPAREEKEEVQIKVPVRGLW